MDLTTSSSCKWRRRKESRPAEIIEAALDLFVVKGFSATRLDEVAKLAGVSKGTVYLYFDSKEDLFCSVVQQIIVPEIEKAERKAADFRGSQRALLTMLIQSWWNVIGKTKLAGIPKLIISEAANFPELAEFYLQKVVCRSRDIIRKGIIAGVEAGEFKPIDPIITTRLLIAPVLFAVIWDKSLAPFDHEKYDLDMYLDHHIDVFFSGICVKND